MDESLADRIARLCVRLAEPSGPLVRDGAPRRKAAEVVSAVQSGAAKQRIERLLGELDVALRTAGYTTGLGTYRNGQPTDVTKYQPLSGLDEYPVEELLVCPAADRCRRTEHAAWDLSRVNTSCAIHDRPLLRTQVVQ